VAAKRAGCRPRRRRAGCGNRDQRVQLGRGALQDRGHGSQSRDPGPELTRLGFDRETLPIEGVTGADAMEIARLRRLTRTRGLSICNRACLALAKRLGLPVVTADREWVSLDLGVVVTLIR